MSHTRFGPESASPRVIRPLTASLFLALSILTHGGHPAFATPTVPGVSFGPRADYATGNYPISITMGDVNNDGASDLVVSNSWGATLIPPSQGTTVTVRLNNGNGTFGPRNDFTVGHVPYSPVIADLNGDGKADLAVANYGGSSVSVLLGNGTGTFGANTEYPTTYGSMSVAVADLNGDAVRDVAVGCFDPSRISVLLGNGDGSLAPRTDYATGGYPHAIAIADMNEDGAPDLLSAGQPGVSVLLNNGDGTFAPKTDFVTGPNPYSMAVGDLNGDGHWDVVTSNNGSGTVATLLGNGDGTLAPPQEFPAGAVVYDVALADFNADGRLDVAVTDITPHTIAILPGDGAGHLGSPTAFVTGSGPISVAAGDLNGDGRPDLATANNYSHTASVLLNDSPVATLLALFEGYWTGAAIEVRWQFATPGVVIYASLERRDGADGPWSVVEGDPLSDGGSTIVLDQAVSAEVDYSYRLVTTTTNGDVVTFGPILVSAKKNLADRPVLAVAPNPSHKSVWIDFAIAREGTARLSVIDARGRRLALLADGVRSPGRYQAVWDGMNGSERAPAGLYFVVCETPDARSVRKLVLTR